MNLVLNQHKPRATGLVWHERMMWHDTGSGAAELPAGGWLEPGDHAESPATKRRLKNLLDATGLSTRLVALAPRQATVVELCRVHAAGYVERIRELSAGHGGDAGEEAPFGGIGISGIGREGGDFALDFYSDLKTLQIADDTTA